MRISVFGLGYVGAVSAACLVRDGHAVVGCDIDANKLELLSLGRSPIVEPGMDRLIEDAHRSGRLQVTADAAAALAASDLSFVCVGTPADADGAPDLTAVRRIAADLGTALRTKSGGHLVAIRSTVPPGTTETIIKPLLEKHSLRRAGIDFDLAFVPEFLREGSSIEDYDHPPFTVCGVDSDRAAAVLRELYGHLPADVCNTPIRVAELLKYCCNTFHALKISFANEVGALARSWEIDAGAVLDLLCRDRRLNISEAYLRPGFAFGGPCLPKDVEALGQLARRSGIEAPLLSAILPSNRARIDAAVRAVVERAPASVGVLGLSFKKGTDDVRDSPLVILVQRLLQSGLGVRIFDPRVVPARLLGANRRAALEALPRLESMLTATAEELVACSDVLVIGHDDESFLEALHAHARDGQTIVDLVGVSDPRIAARVIVR